MLMETHRNLQGKIQLDPQYSLNETPKLQVDKASAVVSIIQAALFRWSCFPLTSIHVHGTQLSVDG